MTIRKVVIGLGLALMAFGIWTLARAHSQVGTCTTSGATGAASHSGLDSSCVQTLMSYSLGFVFVASGLIIAVIAFTMIAKQERLDLHGELKAVPRTWAKRNYVAASVGLDDPLDVLTPPSSAHQEPELADATATSHRSTVSRPVHSMNPIRGPVFLTDQTRLERSVPRSAGSDGQSP